jgi:phage baseplate assembly protein W
MPASLAFRSGAANPPTKDVIYRDLNITFAAHPVTKRLSTLTNADAIKRAVRNLILTNTYERPYNPLFGGNVTAYLFELFTPSLRTELVRRIKETIRAFEPRAKIINVTVTTDEDQNSLFVQIVFRPVNSTAPVQLNLSLERVR